MGETENPSFHAFWIFARVHEPQNQYYLYLPRHSRQLKTNPKSSPKYYYGKYENSEHHFLFLKGWKRWAPKNPDDASNILDFFEYQINMFQKTRNYVL